MGLARTNYGHAAAVFQLDPAADEDWRDLAELLGGNLIERARGPLNQILRIARGRACQTAVVELRYVDPDYRSEYSAFWSGRFEDRPPRAMRVHFFSEKVEAGELPALATDRGYLGYCVLRPTELGAIGRTVIAPPSDLRDSRLASVVDRPSLFGNPLEVRGVPFVQQDGEFLRCAHAAAWICHYVAYHHRVIARRLTAEIAQLPTVEGSKHRALPSNGLTGEQLQGVFSLIGIPAFFYEVSQLPKLPADLLRPKGRRRKEHHRLVEDERIFRVVCKYLNSGFPVVVLTEGDENHAFTLVGWRRTDDGGVHLIACDDQIGPYEEIASPALDGERRGKWKGLMIPLPSKVFLTGEAAESRARQMVGAERDQAEIDNDLAASDLSILAPQLTELRGPVSVRVRLMEGRRYKAVAGRQQRHPEAVRVARMAHLPHWVWVVEFQDRAARDAFEALENPSSREQADPWVLAEVVFDSTSHNELPMVDLLMTRRLAIDPGALDDEEFGPPPDPQPGAPAGDPDAAAVDPAILALGELAGARWRSLINDPRVSDREYGRREPAGDSMAASDQTPA